MADIPVDTLKYAIDGDVAPFRAKAAQVDAEASRLGDSVKAKTANAFDGATAGASRLSNQLKLTASQYQAFAREATATGKSVESLVAAHFRAGSAAETAGKKSVAALAAERVAIQATAREARIAAEQVARASAKASPKGVPLQGYQITNLSQQAQDVMISLGSGQNPLTVLLQQGPQAASAAGGVGNAFKLLGGAAGIARIAVGGLALGVGATLVTAFLKGQGEAAALERRLALIGGAAGVTRGQIEAMSRSVEGVNRGSAREIMGGLAGGGNTPSGSLVQATQLTRDFARATGSSNTDATAFFNEIFDKPAEGARKLAEDFNALTAAQLREIDSLVASGQTRQAVDVIIQNAGENFQGAADQVGILEGAARGASGALGDFWSFLKGIGRPDTAQDQLSRLEGGLAFSRRLGEDGTGFGSLGFREREQEAQRLRAQIRRETREAEEAEQSAANQDILRQANGLGGRWDPAGERARQRAEERALLMRGRAAAAASGGEGIEAFNRFTRQIANLDNPDFVPGSGVPKGRRSPAARIDTGSRDAELARMEVENARELAATSLRDREAVRARQQAQSEFVRNNADPRRRGNAASIRDSRNEAFGISQTARQRDVVTAVQEETAAQSRLAEAYGRGTAAAAAQVQQGQAHAAWLQGQIADEDEYARALSVRATAQAQASEAQGRQQRALSNQALGRLAAAGGNPAALEAARIENEALAQTQTLRDTAAAELLLARSDTELAAARERLAAAEEALRSARAQGGEAAALNRQIAANDNDRQARDSIALREAEIRLAYASTEARIHEIAAINAYNQAISEGLRDGTEDFQRRVGELMLLNEQAALLDATLSGQTNNAKLVDNLRTGLEDIGMAATRGFDSARDAASSFFRQLGDLIVQLYIIQPLLNGLMGTGKGGVGGFLGSLGKGGKGGGGGVGGFIGSVIGSIFGGFRADGGPTQPGKAYIVGERGPELFAPDMAGNVIPIRPPSSQSVQSSGASRQAVDFTYNVMVSGNGDAELLGRMQQIAVSTVQTGLESYGQADSRTIRQRLQRADRRRV